MADAKVAIKVGSIEFSGEGEQKWLATQLDKVIEKAPDLLTIAPEANRQDGGGDGRKPMGVDPEIANKALGTFLRDKGAAKSARKKFLATAVWLEAKGKTRMKPGDVAKALTDNNQTRLANPSQELARNVASGYCERDGDQFYVTDDGKNSL